MSRRNSVYSGTVNGTFACERIIRTMRRLAPLPLLLLLAGCGGSPTGPTPPPPPVPTFTGTVTDTVTGGAITGFTATISNGRLTVSAPGYVTRDTTAGRSTVDLIPEAGFDLAFYRQFARNSLDGAPTGLRVLQQAPSIYLQTDGLTAANVAALEAAARSAVNELTGGRFNVVTWETGSGRRPPSLGWIVVDIRNSAEPCGTAEVGSPAGHIWLNIATRCAFGGFAVYPPGFAHEIGHALGFTHVSTPGSIMKSDGPYSVSGPSAIERHHAAIAYARPRGNRDVDVD
jgi:hypothetical protein